MQNQQTKKPGRPKGSSTAGARSITDAELKRLLAVAKAHSLKDWAYVSFCVGTGARVAEPLMLTIGDVWVGGKVVGSVALDKNKTKSRRSRRLVISKTAQKALGEYLSHELAKGASMQRPLFVGRQNKAQSANYTTQRINQLFREAAIEGGSSHSLRKTFAQTLMQNGVALPHIQKLLGHKHLTQVQAYVSSSDVDLENAVATLHF